MPTKSNSTLLLLVFCTLLVTGCSVTPQQPVSTKPSNNHVQEFSYIVEKGDTLFSIARRFATEQTTLQRRNNISNPNQLAVGMRLIIVGATFETAPQYPASPQQFIWPIAQRDISSTFGARNNRHKGIDLRAAPGTEIYAAADGVVTFVGKQKGYGKVIILEHPNQIKTLYAHNQGNHVHLGQQVRQGEVIGAVGDSGNATGYHLHFEFIKAGKQLNPQNHLGPHQYAEAL